MRAPGARAVPSPSATSGARALGESVARAEELEAQLRAASAERADLGLLAEQLKLRIDEIHRSRTWRWTWPMRRVGEALRR